ncbi:MAG: hypothetical protein ACI85O_002555 [Saprospiraceae bacterium]|jgi:hypothetical protein
MIPKYFLLSFFVLMGTFVHAQSSCKVLKPEIKGKYKGKCKKGLAQGKGEAHGTDIYKGNFFKGLPEGKGTYSYSTGEVYVGEYHLGLKHGKGRFSFIFNEKDTTTVGIWEEDVYVGPIPPPPYEVKMVRSVDRYTIRKISDTGHQVSVKFKQNGSPNTSVQDYRDFFTSGNDLFLNNAKTWQYMEYPFKVNLAYSTLSKLQQGRFTAYFNFIINEPGTWEVILHN